MSRSLLGIYLNDRLADAMAVAAVAKRLAREEGEWAGNGRLDRLADEIAADRDALRHIMATLGEAERPIALRLGCALDKLARFKRNGLTFTRSPLSRMVDLEAMRTGVEGTIAAWRTLRARATVDPRLDPNRLDELISGGRNQIGRLERLRARAAAELFGGDTPAASARSEASKVASR